MEECNIKRPKGITVIDKEEALKAAESIGYPVLVRPSYVIGGQNMTIAYEEGELLEYVDIILAQGIDNPILIDKYMMGTELEVDVISDGVDALIPGVMEHIERAGVHSGDSIAVYPPYNINDKMLKKVINCSESLALALGTKGLINIQYLIYENELYVIEVNPRASRTIPYISKVTGVTMVDIATRVMIGESIKDQGYGTGLYQGIPYTTVKVPVFSFEKLLDANASLGPMMKSTGEVLGIGKTLEEALFKGLVSAGFKPFNPFEGKKGSVLITISKPDKYEIINLAKKLEDLGLNIYATEGTAEEIGSLGLEVKKIKKLSEDNSIIKLMESGIINYVIYTHTGEKQAIEDYVKLHKLAIQLGIPCLTSLDTANALADTISARFTEQNTELVDINNMRKSQHRIY